MRFFVDGDALTGDITLSQEDSEHISKVLRMRVGEEITICDNSLEHLCNITSITKGGFVTAAIKSSKKHSTEPSVFVTVYAALSKGDRFDYLVQKCVEVGASRIVPFMSERCVVKLGDDKDREKKRKRYERIAFEASKQNGRSRPVAVSPIMDYDDAIKEASLGNALLLYEGEQNLSFKSTLEAFGQLSEISFITGPEGGFEPSEVALANELNIKSVLIGPRIMRCETAPVAAVCAVMYHTGNFDIGVG